MILSDNQLLTEIKELIDSGLSVFTSLTRVFDKYINVLKESTNEYLHERYLDFLDVKNRIINNYSNKNNISLANIGECVLLVDELLPSYLLNISKDVKGIISKKGGFTSHSAIICRSLDIPYVVADYPDTYNGEVIIDENKIIINPTDELLEIYKTKEKENDNYVKDLHNIKVFANVSSVADCKKLTDEFSGIGLFRTEFVLMDAMYAFDAKKQASIYEEALKLAAGKPVTFRTFDIGDDKDLPFIHAIRKGVSNYYKYPVLFKTQIEAILLASKKYPKQVKIMFPMIESVEEYKELKKEIVKVARSINAKIPPIGMMLETQRALINIEDFANVEFISVGTNDLAEELFNLKRGNVILYEDIYNVLGIEIKKVIDFCKRRDISISICGELITVKKFAKMMFEAGLTNVSVSPSMIKAIYKALNE